MPEAEDDALESTGHDGEKGDDGAEAEKPEGELQMVRPKRPEGSTFLQRTHVFAKVDAEKLLEGIRPYLLKIINEKRPCKSHEALAELDKAGPSFQYLKAKYQYRLKDKVHHLKTKLEK